ncbi:MAG: sodium:alanine symporter family protein [Candidatus Eisenbacteria bacterium]|uniref:Sodium:alanine symporter family protein n=1 Tax=Eiseniibacteriota bacterium TaxID=2212470 RepID=A0A956LXB2_UNCEI|nr:sodium:alanine symporter family protein [Candidatus Eisenbacteria bacterium]
MGFFETIVDVGNRFVWGWPEKFPILVALLLSAGLFVTLRLSLIQVRSFRHAIDVVRGRYDNPAHEGDISHFQALSTALSATVGIGNIAGVATAIHYGGPGALFWMWVTAFFGMALKYTECTLSMAYRVFDRRNEAAGGPMYYIERGLGRSWKPMAILFAACGAICSFGSGNMNQANTVSLSASTALGMPVWMSGGIMALVVALVIIGGIRRIGAVTSKLAPAMFVVYLVGGLIILGKHVADIPSAFGLIFREAFNPSAGVGGTAAGVFATTLIWGVKRGLFSNEAGQGSAPIAHAAAKTDKPVREGVVAMLGPFIDTLIICTFTGLVIVLTGVWSEHKASDLDLGQLSVRSVAFAPSPGDAVANAAPFDGMLSVENGRPVGGAFAANDGFVLDARILHQDGSAYTGPITVGAGVPVDPPSDLRVEGGVLQNSSALTTWAFERELGGFGIWIVTLSVFLFAISTTISWSYYGDRCTEYLFGAGAVPVYRWLYTGFVFLGAILALESVWAFGDLALGLMSAPNLIAIFLLTGRVKKMTDAYQAEKHVPLR